MRGCTRLAAALCAAAIGSTAPTAAQLVARATYVNEGSFPLPAPGSQSVREPVALATDLQGRVHIVDRSGQVFVYAADGSPDSSYGAGVLAEPIAVAFDSEGTAYVLDRNRRLVQAFEGGEHTYTIGGGGGPARLGDPRDLAVGPAGFVYVLDRSGPTIRIFGRDGAFVRGVGLESVIENPTSIAVDGDGTMLLASSSVANRIYALRPFWELPWTGLLAPDVLEVGATGEPVAVATDGGGTAVLLDADAGRLWGGQRIEPDNGLLGRPIYGGQGTGRGSFREPVDVAFTSDRHLLVLDRELRKVERVALSDLERPRVLRAEFPIRVSQLPPDVDVGAVIDVHGAPGSDLDLAITTNRGRGLAVVRADPGGYTDYYGRRFEAFMLRDGLTGASFSASFGDAAGDVALNDTLLVVAEPDEDRFSVFDLRNGSSLGSYGDNYRDDRRLNDPTGIDLLSDGSVVVADKGNNRVVVFSPDLASLVVQFQFVDVQGVAVSPEDRLFAWDESGLRVVEIRAADFVLTPLDRAVVPGPVRDIDFDPAGNLFMLESRSSRVSVISASLDRVFIRFGGRDPDLRAEYVSVDATGNVYVGSPERGRTSVYRWDLDLPRLANVDVTLTARGVAASWDPIESPFLAGYELQAADAPDGTYDPVASTTEHSVSTEISSDAMTRWVRVAPVTIAGTRARPSDPVRLVHLDMRSADAADDPGMVLGYRRHLDSLASAGALSIGDDVAQELEWRALDAEVELGYYAEAIAREAALEGWTGDDGGYLVHSRLARAHAEMGNAERVLAHAKAALELVAAADRGSDEALDLMRLALQSAYEAGDYATVTELGEEIRGSIAADEEHELLVRMAAARLEVGQAGAALQMADELRLREASGDIQAVGDAPGELAWTALRAAIRLNDTEAVERWRGQAETSATGDRLSRFHVLMGTFALRRGDLEGAKTSINYFRALQDAEAYQEPAAIELSMGLYRALQEQDAASRQAGLAFLSDYQQSIPASAGDLAQQYADSLALFTDREATKAKLGPGFQAWQSANFVAMIQFFEGVLANGADLTLQQELLARSLLAGAYIDIGRPEAAREALQTILALDPDYDTQAANVEASALYGVEPFNGSLSQLLLQLRASGADGP